MASNASWIAASSRMAGLGMSVVSRPRPSLSAATASAPSGATRPCDVKAAMTPMSAVPAKNARDRMSRPRASCSLGAMVNQRPFPRSTAIRNNGGTSNSSSGRIGPFDSVAAMLGGTIARGEWRNGRGPATKALMAAGRTSTSSRRTVARTRFSGQGGSTVCRGVEFDPDGKGVSPRQRFEEICTDWSARQGLPGDFGDRVAEPASFIEPGRVLGGEQKYRCHESLDRNHGRTDRQTDTRGQSKPPKEIADHDVGLS